MTTTNEKAPGVSDDSKGLVTDATNALNSATGNCHGKAQATLIAKLAHAGHAVHQSTCGGYLVSKYGYTHYAPDFAALQAFACKLGVAQ